MSLRPTPRQQFRLERLSVPALLTQLPALWRWCLSAALIIYILSYSFALLQRVPLGYDAWAYFAAARAFPAGASPYVSLQELARYVPEAIAEPPAYLYPPTLALTLTPLASLPLNTAVAIWVGFLAICTVLLILLLSRVVDRQVAVIAVLGFTPTWSSLWNGQVNVVIAIFLLLALLAYRRQKPGLSGVWLSAGTLLKITPVVLLGVAVLHKSWRTVWAWIAFSMLFVVCTLPFVPLEAWYTGTLFALLNPSTNAWCVSFTALISRLPAPIGTLTSIALSLVFVVITFIRVPKLPNELAFAATTLLPILIARTVWEHHTVMALPALAIIWSWGKRGQLIATAVWLIISFMGSYTIPLALTICWVICCWPRILDAQEYPEAMINRI